MKWYDRLNIKIRELGWNKTTLAQKSGIKYDNVVKYCDGEVENPRGNTMAILAKTVGTTEEWLRLGVSLEANSNLDERIANQVSVAPSVNLDDDKKLLSVPLVTLGQFYMDTTQGTDHVQNTEKYVTVDVRSCNSENLVSIAVHDESMISNSNSPQKSLYINDSAVIDLNAKIMPGDIVLALVSEYSEYVIRKFKAKRIDPDGFAIIELTPLNTDYPVIEVQGIIDEIVKGKVIQSTTSF